MIIYSYNLVFERLHRTKKILHLRRQSQYRTQNWGIFGSVPNRNVEKFWSSLWRPSPWGECECRTGLVAGKRNNINSWLKTRLFDLFNDKYLNVKDFISIGFYDVGGFLVIAVLGHYNGKLRRVWSILDELVQTSINGHSIARED